MLFRRIIISAVFVGICSGLFLTISQNMRLLEIVLEAEKYELPAQSLGPNLEPKLTHKHSHQSDHHLITTPGQSNAIWSPANGPERLSYTFAANILAAIGFATILIALMSFGERQVSWRSGLVWGLAGFTVFFVSPSLGLPPELPGMQTADFAQRQSWWLMAVISTAAGLACIAFAEKYYKILGVGLLFIPHIVGAPQPPVNSFIHPDASVVASMEQLHNQFIQLASFVNFFYWLVLGLMSAFLVQRYIKSPGNLSKDQTYKIAK